MNLKIILACHKPCYLIKDDVYIPVFAGKSLSSNSKKGKSKTDSFYNSCIGDNETDFPDGEISSKNKSLNEMTVVYWAWKNYEKIGNPEHIGFGHYRRFFIFERTLPRSNAREVKNSRYFSFPDYKSILPYIDTKNAEDLLLKYDILTTENYDVRNLGDDWFYTGCKSRFYAMADFNPELYDLMESLVLKNNPDYAEEIEELRKKPSHFRCNMFVMKKEDFFRYCEFVFPILFALDEENKSESRRKEMRAPGYLAEYLTTMFILHCFRADGKKIKELDTAFVENTDKFKSWRVLDKCKRII